MSLAEGSKGVPTSNEQAFADDPPEADIGADLDELAIQERPTIQHDTRLRSTEAEQVRRQVDYYFSEENLQKDTFLLSKMKGRKNKPVPIKLITGFAKMHQYQPLSFVVACLQTSNSVNVVKDNGTDCVQRKQPFIKPEHLKAGASNSRRTSPNPTIQKWAKPSAASGFEPYFAEAPLPPDVAAEEAELYDPITNSFEERMENAIQRYMARRKFNSTIRNIFLKWMHFGGVDALPKSFTSNIDPERLVGLTAKEKKEITTPKPYLPGEELDDHGEPKWIVDMEAVTKSFLSTFVADYFHYERRDDYYELTNTMKNFLRYLQYHRVCLDHDEAVNASIRVCDLACRELPACDNLQANLPGAFNTAGSTLFGGFFKDVYAGDKAWANQEGIENTFGLSSKNAKQLFVTGLVAFEHQKPGFGRKIENPLHQEVVGKEEDVGLEVVEILAPTPEVMEMYNTLNVGFEPLGRLVCKSWTQPSLQDWDLPPHVNPTNPSEIEDKTYTFVVEESILYQCQPGLKFESARILNLEPYGLQILDGIPTSVRCSFYTVLENELVQKWKEPRWITRQEQKERARIAEEMKEPPPPLNKDEIEAMASSGADDDFD